MTYNMSSGQMKILICTLSSHAVQLRELIRDTASLRPHLPVNWPGHRYIYFVDGLRIEIMK